jgi:phosphoglycolate phosphatase-like HAD superfamily hydrolase
MVGDSHVDVAAGKAAGTRTILLGEGEWPQAVRRIRAWARQAA